MNKETSVVIYHANCLDGLGAAYAAKLVLKDTATYHPWQYGNKIPKELVESKEVYFLDFTPKREEFLEIMEVAKNVVVLDHHKTANEELGDLVNIDQTKSGAVLTWEYFHNEELPMIYKYIQDSDLWKWEFKDETASFLNYVGLFPLTLEFFDKHFNGDMDYILTLGKDLEPKFLSKIELNVKNASTINFLGYEVSITNVQGEFISKTLNILAKDKPFALGYSVSNDKVGFSIRGDNDSPMVVDCSEIAKKFGGGGHRLASGFRTDIPTFCKILKGELTEAP